MGVMAMGGDFPDDASFRTAVSGVLSSLLDQVDDIEEGEIDARLTSGNLTVHFEDLDAIFVLSQQTPTHELWLSANLTAWHFRFRDGVWVVSGMGLANG